MQAWNKNTSAIILSSLLVSSLSVNNLIYAGHDPIVNASIIRQTVQELNQWKEQVDYYKQQIKLLEGKKKFGEIATQTTSFFTHRMARYYP